MSTPTLADPKCPWAGVFTPDVASLACEALCNCRETRAKRPKWYRATYFHRGELVGVSSGASRREATDEARHLRNARLWGQI